MAKTKETRLKTIEAAINAVAVIAAILLPPISINHSLSIYYQSLIHAFITHHLE